MNAPHDTRETWDRLTLLLIARPRKGWEDKYEEITQREIERLAPRQNWVVESPADGLIGRGESDGTTIKGDSAYGRSIPG